MEEGGKLVVCLDKTFYSLWVRETSEQGTNREGLSAAVFRTVQPVRLGGRTGWTGKTVPHPSSMTGGKGNLHLAIPGVATTGSVMSINCSSFYGMILQHLDKCYRWWPVLHQKFHCSGPENSTSCYANSSICGEIVILPILSS